MIGNGAEKNVTFFVLVNGLREAFCSLNTISGFRFRLALSGQDVSLKPAMEALTKEWRPIIVYPAASLI